MARRHGDHRGNARSERESPAAVEEAVRTALVESRGQLTSFLRRRLGSSEDAEDVLQCFILRAIERSGQLREIGSLRGWLARILATTIADHERRGGRRRQRERATEPAELEMVAGPTDAEIDRAVCDCLHRLLPTLRDGHAALIRRIDLEGEAREAVAASHGITRGALAVRLHRARQALKRRLLEMCLTCPEHGFLDCGCETARAASEAARLRETAADV